MNYIEYIISFLLGKENSIFLPYVSYGYNEEAKIIIVPSDFFDPGVFLTEKSLPDKTISYIDGIPVLFGNPIVEENEDKIYLYADIIASAFFMITRYEECVNKKRDKHGRFIKGVSGNPNGRPKDDTVKDRLFPLVPKSIERLQQILDNPDSLPRDVIKVAEIVLDRVYGKAEVGVYCHERKL